jgi:hypothetical protein
MSRAKFTQSDIDRISKAAARTGVPIVAEFIAPDGSKITITAAVARKVSPPRGVLTTLLQQYQSARTFAC